jgi:type I restriction enzyme S subunit
VTTKWKKHYLKDLCLKITDGTHKTPLYTEKGVMFLSAKNIKDGQFNLTDHKFISFEEHKDLIKRCNPETEDVMLSKSGSLGDAVVVPRLPFEFSIFESLALLKVKKEKINPYYLKQYLCSPLSRRYFWSITSGIAVKHLHLVDLRKMPIFVPPIRMQEEIIKFLNAWEAVIEKIERLIAAKQKRLKGLIQQLINKNCGLWLHFKARDLFSNISIKGYGDEELLSVTQDCGVLPRTMLKGRVMSPEGSTDSYKLVVPGNFVISLRSFQGGVEYSKYRGIVSPAYTILSPKKEIHDDFYRHFFKSYIFIEKYLAIAVVGIRDGKQISFSDFETVKIPYPPIQEQRLIAEIFNAAIEEVGKLKQLADKYRTQKRGLMQKLLTGEWRVNAAKEVA